MKLEKAINVFVLSYKNKKYKRASTTSRSSNQQKVEWRRDDSNHKVKKSKSKELEESFSNLTDGFIKTKSSNKELVSSRHVDADSLSDNVSSILKESKSTLQAVKYVKEVTGLGLRDAKYYVDDIKDSIKGAGIIQ